MPEVDRRRLVLAVAASVLAHLGLFTTVVRVPRVRLEIASKPVQAVINPSTRVAPVEAPVVAAAERVTPGLPPPSGRGVRAQTGVREPVSRPAAGASSTHVKADRPSAFASAGTTAPAAASAVSREGVSADALRQYRVALAIASRRFKRYPPTAREHGWQGRVEIAVSGSVWQRTPEISLIVSSGHMVLDEEALAMIEQAVASTLLPESMKARDFRVLLPIEFSLDDAR